MTRNLERKKETGKEERFHQGKETNVSAMRQYITEVAQRLSDERLLKVLYIRAKTLEHLE